MKAVIYREYGPPDTLRLEETDKPDPKDNEVLVKVYTAAANAADWHMLRGEPFLVRLMAGLRRPRYPILGADIAGRVEAVGGKVEAFKPGDEVFGILSASGWGGFAEYVCASEDALALKPANVSWEAAAALPMAALTALQGLRDLGRLQAGQQVLINGASGGVGSFAVQIARALGAVVTGVCSTRNLELVRSMGADHVIDYTQHDVTRYGRCYDLILDTAGYRAALAYRQALRPSGTYVFVGGSTLRFFQAMLAGPLISILGSKRFAGLLMQPRHKDLVFLQQLLEAGKLAPVIDRRYVLSEVPQALSYLEAGHTQGKVVITVA